MKDSRLYENKMMKYKLFHTIIACRTAIILDVIWERSKGARAHEDCTLYDEKEK